MTAPSQMSQNSVRVFYAYAHEDASLREQLEKHLSLLRRTGLIENWHDQQIMPGEEWTEVIHRQLNRATIILLLISADFLASDVCYEIEMQQALERHRRGKARIIPVIVRPCDWHNSPFAHLQCLPRGGKPVMNWDNQDDAFLSIAQEVRLIIAQQQIPLPSLLSVERQNRMRLLKRVQNFWIKGVLEQSLHHAALIALGFDEQRDAIANPWSLTMQETKQTTRPLPPDTHIKDIYDEANGELLILGEPGSGKTTILLGLARDLICRADADEHHAIPVVFNLSSWAEKRQSLEIWLVEELHIKYRVPKKVGRAWIATDQILLLLDGLDEVAPKQRNACVHAINHYHQEHELVSIVVCSRKTEYFMQTARLQFETAITIQPLTGTQIEEYLLSAGKQLDELRIALHADVLLQELATTPLMLNILTLAYHGKNVKEPTPESAVEELRDHVFAVYVQRMLERRKAETRYSPQKTIHWLTQLARQLKQHNQTEFYLEQIQPNWLSRKLLLLLYRGLSGGFIGCLLGLFLIEPIALIFTLASPDTNLPWNPLNGGMVFGTLPGLVVGLIIGLISHKTTEIRPSEAITWSWIKALRVFIIAVVIGPGGWLLLLHIISPFIVNIFINSYFLYSTVDLLIYFISLLLLGGFISVTIYVFSIIYSKLQRRRILKQKLWQAAREGILVGFVTMIIDLLFLSLSYVAFIYSFNTLAYDMYGIVTTVIAGFLVGFIMGFSSRQLDKNNNNIPNIGTIRHTRNAIIIGGVAGVSAGLLFPLSFSIFHTSPVYNVVLSSPFSDIANAIPAEIDGLFLGAALGLFYGGIASINHYILRFFLWKTRIMPWNYVRFLDYVTERLLLRKVGGGYIFVHRLLLDYLAALDDTTFPKNTPSKSNIHKQGKMSSS